MVKTARWICAALAILGALGAGTAAGAGEPALFFRCAVACLVGAGVLFLVDLVGDALDAPRSDWNAHG